MEMQTERTDLWTQCGRERVGPIERVAWKYTLPREKQPASGNLLCDAGGATQCSVTTQRDGMGWEVGGILKREGIYVYLWLIHADVWKKPRQ